MATFRNGSKAEEDIELKIKVEDQNDNPPIFKQQRGSVRESSKIGEYYHIVFFSVCQLPYVLT